MRLMLRHYPKRKGFAILFAFAHGDIKALGRGVLNGEFWKLYVHPRAWLSAVLYLPKARRFRVQWRKQGDIEKGRFWPLVRTDCLYPPQAKPPR
jgi:hypothetical protein